MTSKGPDMSDGFDHRNLLRANEAAEHLAISDRQLRQLIADGALPYVNVGTGVKRPSYRFRIEDWPAAGLVDRQLS